MFAFCFVQIFFLTYLKFLAWIFPVNILALGWAMAADQPPLLPCLGWNLALCLQLGVGIPGIARDGHTGYSWG